MSFAIKALILIVVCVVDVCKSIALPREVQTAWHLGVAVDDDAALEDVELDRLTYGML